MRLPVAAAVRWPAVPRALELALLARLHPPSRYPRVCSSLLDAAVCVGIDAEWDPAETEAEARSGGPPHATLVQLGLWLPPGCSSLDGKSDGGGGACLVLLLDMLELPQAAAKRTLQRLFRQAVGWAPQACRRCLNVEWGAPPPVAWHPPILTPAPFLGSTLQE